MDMTPVDYVAAAVAIIGAQASSLGRTFNIFNPAPMSYTKIGLAVAAAGYPADMVSYAHWRNRLLRDEG
jgi:hypothetical protein